MDAIWLPPLLVLGLGAVYAALDAWWARQHDRLVRERRRTAWAECVAASVPADASVPPGAADAGVDAPAAGGDGPRAETSPDSARDGHRDPASAAASGRGAGPRAEPARESDMPAQA